MAMYTISIANLNEFRESREAWNGLARRMHFPSIFCTWEWIYTWWEHFGEAYDPLILFIRNGSELAGILPLALGRSATGDWLKGRTLTYCGSNELYPDHLDIICAPQEADACLDAVLDFLTDDYTDWEVLKLSALADDSRIMARLTTSAVPLQWESRRISAARFIPLSGSFDNYLNTFDKKQRYNLRSRRKKLLEQHDMRYVVCDSPRYAEGLNTLFRLHSLRAEKKKIVSSFSGDRIVRYHNALVGRLEPSAVWLRWLECDGAPIAAAYNFEFEGCVFSYQKGFDPAWERFGPGMVIVYEAIQEAFARGYHEYNFLRGGEEYKDTWTPHSRALLHCNIYNSTIRGGLTMASTRSLHSVKQCIKKLVGHGA
jgi:CelD/BcsL family acetyltransferase involved in cellulose biosynthesis